MSEERLAQFYGEKAKDEESYRYWVLWLLHDIREGVRKLGDEIARLRGHLKEKEGQQ